MGGIRYNTNTEEIVITKNTCKKYMWKVLTVIFNLPKDTQVIKIEKGTMKIGRFEEEGIES